MSVEEKLHEEMAIFKKDAEALKSRIWVFLEKTPQGCGHCRSGVKDAMNELLDWLDEVEGDYL